MNRSFALPLFLAAGLAAFAQQTMPRMNSVDPGNGKAGDEITVAGENLEKLTARRVRRPIRKG